MDRVTAQVYQVSRQGMPDPVRPRPRRQLCPARCPLGSSVLGLRGQDLARLYLERLGQFPNGAKGDGAAGFDALIVPEAEAKVHHVLLCEGASLPKRANTAPEKQAEAWEVCRHQGATLGQVAILTTAQNVVSACRGCSETRMERPWSAW